MSKRSISAKALVEDLRNGLSDSEVMSRHELSFGQLQKIFAQLVKAGYVAQEVLDGRRKEETKPSSLKFDGTHVPAMATESRSSGSAHPVPIEPHSFGLSDHKNPSFGRDKSRSRSPPLSREEASRVRRNGLILIIASFGFVTMAIVLARLREGAEVGAFPTDEVGAALAFFASLGWIVTATSGCLWRVRGLGQHPVWAMVAPFMGNLVVVEALSNRYEPESDRRGLRLALAILGLAPWGIAMAIVARLL